MSKANLAGQMDLNSALGLPSSSGFEPTSSLCDHDPFAGDGYIEQRDIENQQLERDLYRASLPGSRFPTLITKT